MPTWKDSIQPPYDYQGSLSGLLEYFISRHNEAVEDKKKFIVGNVTVSDDNDYVHYSSSEYSVTLDAIKAKLLNTHGGYLIVRYTDSGKVLDYLSEFNEQSVQTVEFGKNLLDVKITKTMGRGQQLLFLLEPRLCPQILMAMKSKQTSAWISLL